MTFAEVMLLIATGAVVIGSAVYIAGRVKRRAAMQLIAFAVIVNTARAIGARHGWFASGVAIALSFLTILLMAGVIVLVFQDNWRRIDSDRIPQ